MIKKHCKSVCIYHVYNANLKYTYNLNILILVIVHHMN